MDGVSDDILRARFLSFLESFPTNKVLHNLLDLQPYPFTNIHILRAISAWRMIFLSPWPWSEPWHACRCLSSASLNNSIAKRLVIMRERECCDALLLTTTTLQHSYYYYHYYYCYYYFAGCSHTEADGHKQWRSRLGWRAAGMVEGIIYLPIVFGQNCQDTSYRIHTLLYQYYCISIFFTLRILVKYYIHMCRFEVNVRIKCD